MTWPLIGVITVLSIVAAWYIKSHGLAGVAMELPNGFGSHKATVHMAGAKPYVNLSLPTFTQGSAYNAGGGNMVAPAPYFVSVTVDGTPLDVMSNTMDGGQSVDVPITQPKGQIVAVYKESVALGIIPLQSVVPNTTCTVTYGP